MRQAFVSALLEARAEDERLFVLDADCSRSTQTARFAARYPDSFLNVGIAEQHLIGMAAGLALAGLTPVACSFAAILVARAGEQILQSVAAQKLSVKIAGHYAGMSGAREGAPHHSITDLAFMRAVPGMAVWIPAEDADVGPLTRALLAEPGPAYIRLCRDPVTLPQPHAAQDRRWRLWSPGGDVLLVAGGAIVGQAIEAVALLERDGIRTTVFAPLCLKPFPDEALLAALSDVRVVVTVEEHDVLGGIGGAVAEVVAEAGGPRVIRSGISDCFTETGAYTELLERYGLTAPHIAATVRRALGPTVSPTPFRTQTQPALR